MMRAAPASFLVRCSRNGAGPTPGMCLQVQAHRQADLTVRFPRDWLEDWRSVTDSIERLIAKLRPPGGDVDDRPQIGPRIAIWKL